MPRTNDEREDVLAFKHCVAVSGSDYLSKRMPMLNYSEHGCIQIAGTNLVSLGSEKRGLEDEGWQGEQRIHGRHVIAFSLLPIEVSFEDENAVVLAPITVAMASPGNRYTRAPLSRFGQRTLFVAMDSPVARECVADHDVSATDREDPFPARSGPSCAKAMAMAIQLERLVFQANGEEGALAFDELALQIIALSIGNYYQKIDGNHQRPSQVESGQHRQVRHAIAMMCRAPQKNWSLSQIAKEVSLSPPYLSRIFKRETGRTLTESLRLIRVVHSLKKLPDCRRNLTALALDCGFASHAHMSSTFTKLLGATPSSLAKSSPRAISNSIKSISSSIPMVFD